MSCYSASLVCLQEVIIIPESRMREWMVPGQEETTELESNIGILYIEI